jgi:hypothetical protein
MHVYSRLGTVRHFRAIAPRLLCHRYTIHHPFDTEMDYILPLTDLRLQVDQWALLALVPGQSRNFAKYTAVRSITQYKSKTDEEHETLLIILDTPSVGASPGKTTYMVTDRGPNQSDMATRSGKNPPLSPSSACPPATFSPSSPEVRANDRIFVPGWEKYQPVDIYERKLKEEYNALCTVTPTRPMSLAQLAILLKAVSKHSVHYDLLKYQCYWYAYTVWEVVRTYFSGAVTDDGLQRRRGKYKGVKIRREDSVEAATEMYGRAWTMLCEEEARTQQQEEAKILQVKFAVTIVYNVR